MAIVAVGHRGTILNGPENSIESHERAYLMGARGIEFDIQTTKDGVFVVFHDSELDLKSTGTGKLKNKNYDEIQGLYLRDRGDNISVETIPTLEAAMRNVRGRFMVDLDFKEGPDNSAEILRDLLIRTGFEQEQAPLVTLFCRSTSDYDMLKSLQDLCQVRPLYQNKEQIISLEDDGVRVMGIRNYQYKSSIVKIMRNSQISAFVNSMPLVRKRDVSSGLIGSVVAAITGFLDRSAEKIYKKASKDRALFIQTDDLPNLVKFLKEKNLYQDRVLNRNFEPIDQVIHQSDSIS